ncbi:mucin-5AC isoform X9 [Drosophila miranda]|uniref:mucin-5AC isoform X9 n=1 Tax=Drosophila miranda TaxID=7229 RepID=UPI00143FA288|nr:mucin-5AC isoform X9 [Drosophila miranda]
MLPFRRGAAWQTLFLLCALAYCINEASSEGRVVCYYTNWSVYRPGTAKFNPQNINPYLCTHLVYAFGGFTKDNQMKPFDKYQDIEQGGYAKFTGLKTYNKQLKTMIAIGGWNEASSRFSPLVASGERRQQFIKNILKFLRQNHFDGIDLDWEYPAHREGGKSRDRDNYAQFVQELRAEFEREAQKTGRTRLLLTMAVPAGIEYIDKGYDVPKLNKYLDWFNVLTYDFHSSHEPSVNHHAPLYSLEEDSEYNYDAELNIDYSIKYYLKAGADRDKLVLGIPTYGRSYTLINEESTELGAPSEGPGEQGDATREKGYLAYYEICQTLKDDPEWTVVQPNANVMGPYAYRRNQWVGYDDEAMVRKKAEYVVAHGLGGIMFWAIDNDDFRGTCNGKPYPLIEAAKEAMVDALGLGINEVAKSNGPQKPSRSRSRDNAVQNRNRLNAKTEAPTPASSRRGPSGGRRTSSTAAPPPPSTTFRLTEADGSSLYIGGRGSTTPAPPTTPDPGSDFKCEEEGFFQHPRDCKKYYWCLDSGPSGLGIVAHQFTCPSGLYFNPAADSCDFARNVPCKSKKSTTASPPVTSTTTTTTVRPNRVTAAPPARPIYAPRTTSSTSTTSTTTTAAPPAEDELEYEEEGSVSDDEPSPGEEDPQVIKELIDLIRKVGGVEQLEKHLLRNKDGSITLKENSASGAPTTPSTISKSLYDRVLSRPGTLNSFTRNRLKINESPASAPETRTESNSSSNSNANYSKYSSVLRGNSRQGPQNEGIEKLTEFDGFLKERKQYVTINRHRSSSQGESEAQSESEEAVEEQSEPETTTRRPISAATPSYTSLRRSRPSTTAASAAESSQEEEEEEQVVQSLSQVKSYATLSRTRGRGTTERPEATTTSSTETESILSSTTNRYKYFERTRPTKSGNVEDAAADPEEDEEEYEEDEPQQNVTVQSKQSLTSHNQNTRKYASIGRSRTTTTTETPPETTTATNNGTETAKASTTTTNNNNNNSSYNVKQNNNKNPTIPTTAESTTTPQPQPPSTTQPETTTNETPEPIESTTSTTNTQHTSPTTPATPTPTPTTTTTPILGSTSIDSDSLATDEPLGDASPTIPLVLDVATSTTTTTTETELGTTPPTTTTTITGNTERNDVDVDDSDDSEVTKTKTQYTKYATTNRRRVTTTTTAKTPTTTTTNNNNNPEAAIDASRNGLNSISNPNVNSIRTTYSGRRQPQRTTQTQTTTTTEPPTTTNPNTLGSVSSPRPFGYPRRRTRPTVQSTTTSTTTINKNDNDNANDKQITDAVVNVVKKTRLSQVDRPKEAQLSTSTTQSPPPATTLLHVFTLLEGEGEVEEQTASTSTIRPPKAPSHRSSIAEPKHKLIEINRIVEINSKQAKAAQRKSKANQQDFGMLRVESLPHVEQLGEISVVKYVHLVDGSAIQINDGHSTVADYTPTEPTAYRSPSAPVRNTLPLNEADTETEADRSGKSLLPEVISGALETSTISLEGLFDSPRKGKQLSSNSILQDDTEEPTTIESESETTVVPPTFAAVQATYLRQPTTANVSRRPVLSVRRRIINTPTSAAAAAAAATAATTTQIAELTTTSKYNRLRSRPAVAAATTIPAAAATATAATTPPAAAVGATSAAVAAAASANRGSSNSNGYLSKLKAKSSSSAETTAAIVSGSSSSSSASSNDITQKQHKFQPASFALRRQFQTRRLTTFAPGASSGDESDVFLYTAATEVPRTQNPLFKRRLTLISTTPPPATRTTIVPALTETTTNLYANEDDEDQVAKSSIHTSRFNQIPFESVASSGSTTTSSSTTSTTAATPLALGPGIRRQLVPRPRRPQSTTVATPYYSTGNPGAGHSAPPLSRRQQSRRRPHKYIEVYSRPPSKPALVTATASSRRNDYPAALDYEEGGQRRRSSKSQSALQSQSQSEPKVIVHGRGIIECRAQGNFPHPLNCRKFISCARFEETGGIVGWEYTCPKGLTYDSNDGMCTWSPSDHVACRD